MKLVQSLQSSVFRIVVVVFLLITCHLLLITPVSAEGEFETSYDVTYDIGTDGNANVNEKITLTNLTPQYYATEFSLSIGSTQITDLSASDSSGPLEVETDVQGTNTVLKVKFSQQIVGEGKQLVWNLKYKSRDYATSLGKVWEVYTPRIVPSPNIKDYNVSILVPRSFGDPTSISPTPVRQTVSGDKLVLNFNKNQLISSGVSANFGTNQLFEFTLNYELTNPNFKSALTNITIPADTAYQDVFIESLEPRPENVTVDDDGNYIAWYKLNRGQKLNVQAKGIAKLYTNSKVKEPKLDPKLKTEYLKSDKYWEKDNTLIKTKLSEILGKNPPKSNYEKAKLIHRYVATNLKYDESRLNEDLERLGAVTVLNNPEEAVCMEFTDLFISLARAAGIPSRELNGYAYTPNSTLRPLSLSKDFLHAWPEFWDDERGWVMIDPTWENTTGGVDYFAKFDLNHFVLVTKGISSQRPGTTDDTKVKFTDREVFPRHQLDAEIKTEDSIVSGFNSKLKVKVINLGNTLQKPTSVNVNAGQLNILNNSVKDTGPIPPYGHFEEDFNFRTNSLIDAYKDNVEVTVAGQKFRKEVEVQPLFIFRNFPWILAGVVSIMALIYFTILGVFVYRRRILKIGQMKK